mgnify:CR=1 FL=1
MRHLTVVVALLLSSATVLAQSSVMIDELTTNEVQAAIDGGKTTAIYYVGGTHENGPAVPLGKHNLLAAHLSRRVAETLGDALAYPPNPYAPAGNAIERTGQMAFAGTISISMTEPNGQFDLDPQESAGVVSSENWNNVPSGARRWL